MGTRLTPEDSKPTASGQPVEDENYRQFFDGAPIAVIIYDLGEGQRQILYANRFARQTWEEVGGGELVGMSVQAHFDPMSFYALLDGLKDFDWIHGVEIRLPLPDGRSMPVLLSGGEVTFEGHHAYLLYMNDLRRLEEAQIALKQKERTLAAIEERERLARELHDDLGQSLAYLNVQAQATTRLMTDGKLAAAQANLQQMARVAQEAQEGIRRHILGLRSAEYMPGTLYQAIDNYLEQFTRDTGISATLSVPDDVTQTGFMPAIEEQILRIVQEALVNVRKHAAARKAEVLFSYAGEWAQVVVSDDGVGFAPEQASSAAAHFGLRFMAERAAQIGGRLEVRSAPGKGSRVLLEVPRLISGDVQHELENEDVLRNLRVLVVDDHPLFLEGIRQLLVSRGITVVGAAHDGLEAQRLARSLQPDLILMDLEMSPVNGLEATQAIKAEMPDIKIVMLTVSADANNLLAALRNGASGYLLKSLDANAFCHLLAGVVRGESPLPSAFAAQVLAELAQRPPTPVAQQADELLTPRQQDILRQLAAGMTYKEIAAAQSISVQGIKYHMSQILDRLNLSSRQEAIAYARRNLLA